MDAAASTTIYGCWRVTSLGCYFAIAVIVALAERLLLIFFRSLAVARGDFPDAKEGHNTHPMSRGFGIMLCGFGRQKEHADFWLPFFIGLAELLAYPVFVRVDAYELLGGWLVLKTAGQWSGWQHSRTSFNRFLLANIINVFVAYFWLSRYVDATCLTSTAFHTFGLH
jgi:hypothetical protein